MIIAHRANLQGKSKEENTIESINECIKFGLDIEIDIWYLKNSWWLGHDKPQYKFDLENFDFKYSKIFLHCKNIKTLNQCCESVFREEFEGQIDYFYHDSDNATLTSNGYIWTYPGKKLYQNSICVMPENCSFDYFRKAIKMYKNNEIYGICTDFPLNMYDIMCQDYFFKD